MPAIKLVAQYEVTGRNSVYWRLFQVDQYRETAELVRDWAQVPTLGAMRLEAERCGATLFQRFAA